MSNNKSHWFEGDQKGNFSNEGQDTFDPGKGYIGIRLQQGVPLLDRDWNELEDIRRHAEVMLRWLYVGDGTPIVYSFKISAADRPFNDFKITRGRYLVKGFEVVNESDITYSQQPDVPPLTIPSEDQCDSKGIRRDMVYLDVWIEEVTAKENGNLDNNQDVNMETCIRHKIKWCVRVREGKTPFSEEKGHHYSIIAYLNRKANIGAISEIEDKRRTKLSLREVKKETDANKENIADKTGGTISSSSDIQNVSTDHIKQVNVSSTSTASGEKSQVNASSNSTASGATSQVNASWNSTASGGQSQVNASENSTSSGVMSQVNASWNSTASEARSQVNASYGSEASNMYSQVNASIRVQTNGRYTVCGGYANSSAPSTANRKWELNSQNGNIKHSGTIQSGALFSDYGEYFENLKKGEIDMGLLIALEGVKVRPAKKDEDFIGVVSGTAAIRLGDSPFCWQGRYLVDEWGQPVYEEIKDPDWEPKKVPDEKWKPKKGETEEDRPMIAVETEKDRPTIRVQKENPEYDIKREQIPRSERPKEWTLVGLLGQVYVRCDDTVKPGGFIKSKGKGIGTASKEKTKLRVMKITKEYDGKYSIALCLLK